jgi:glycosyltransferase involved in cell wall biosynthesis
VKPFASVITPTLGRPELERALESLRAQDLEDWEAVVVDDGDGAGIELARRLGDSRIAAVPNPGAGQVDARNAAITLARGEVVCWLDDDDWWDDPAHLSALRDAAGSEPRFFYRGGWIVFDDGTREEFDLDATPDSLLENNTILTSSIAYPRAIHRRLGLLDRELGGYCDWDLMLRMCAAAVLPERLPGAAVCYAIHESNVSADFAAPQRLAYFERFRAKHGLDVEIANHLRIHRLLSRPAPPPSSRRSAARP